MLENGDKKIMGHIWINRTKIWSAVYVRLTVLNCNGAEQNVQTFRIVYHISSYLQQTILAILKIM